MKRALAAIISLAMLMSPLGGLDPAHAAGRVIQAGKTGQSINLPVQAISTPGNAFSRNLIKMGGSVSLNSILPGFSGNSIVGPRTAAAQIEAFRAYYGHNPAIISRVRPHSPITNKSLSDHAIGETRAGPIAAPIILHGGPGLQTTTSKKDAAQSTPFKKTLSAIRSMAASATSAEITHMSDVSARSHGSELFDTFQHTSDEADFSAAADEWEETARLREADNRKERLQKTPSWSARQLTRLARSPAGRLLPGNLAVALGRDPVPQTRFSPDQYGGPRKLETALPAPAPGPRNWIARKTGRLTQKIGYAAKWAVNMVGIAALMGLALKPLQALTPWQLGLGETLLSFTGRVELLTSVGPDALAQLMANAPFAFLFTGLPVIVLMEELSYRLMAFWLPFIALIVVRTLAEKLSGLLATIPNPFIQAGKTGARASAPRGLLLPNWIKRLFTPYALASVFSAAAFAAAHIPLWGFIPYTFALHFALGLVLARLSYRTRGLFVPLLAHFLFNTAMILTGFWLPWVAAPGTVAVLTALISAAAVTVLLYNAWSHRRDKAAAISEARGLPPKAGQPGLWKRILTAALILPLLITGFHLTAPDSTAVPAAAPAETVTTITIPGRSHGFSINEAIKQAAGTQAVQRTRELSTAQIVKKVKSAVVMVRTDGGLGSGFIISRSGLLVTNAHVVSKSVAANPLTGRPKIAREHHAKVTIQLANGTAAPGIVVGFNADKDIALVQLPPNLFGWPSVTIGDSGRLAEGEKIIVMGHPRGLPFSVSEGIVSGLGGRGNGFVGYIQHDASINPGNSGGPLFNTRGEVVGINSMIMSSSGGFDGIAYSITAADLQKALNQYAKIHNIDSAWMGAIFNPVDPDAPRYGASIEVVRPGSPAAAAGLQGGDVILQVDGHKLSNDPKTAVKQMESYFRGKMPTDEVEIKIARNGGVQTLTIRLGGR